MKTKYGYGNKIRGISDLEATDIEISESETIEEEETKILSVTKTEEASGEIEIYYVEIQGIWYPISQNNTGIILGEGVPELPTAESLSQQFTATSSDDDIVIAEAKDNEGVLTVTITGQSLSETSTATIEVKYGSITKNITVTVKKLYTVTVNSEDSINKGTVAIMQNSKNSKYPEGYALTIQSTPKDGYRFNGWYEANSKISRKNQYEYIVHKDTNIVAKFTEKLKYGEKANIGDVYVNDIKLINGWLYYYEDSSADGYIYLIYEDYLEGIQIPLPENGKIRSCGYSVDSTNYARELLSWLENEEIWENIAEGMRTAINLKLPNDRKIRRRRRKSKWCSYYGIISSELYGELSRRQVYLV